MQPKIGQKVIVDAKSDGNGVLDLAPNITQKIIAVYPRNRVKTQSGDVWQVTQIHGNQNAQWRIALPEFLKLEKNAKKNRRRRKKGKRLEPDVALYLATLIFNEAMKK